MVFSQLQIILKHLIIRREQHWFSALMSQYNYGAPLLKYSLLFGIVSTLLLLIVIEHNFCSLFLMWFINVSSVNIGQRFMGYGWHAQVVEFGF